MFLTIILFPNLQHLLLIPLLTPPISPLTTPFPPPQIPNIIHKPLTPFIFLPLFLSSINIKNKLLLTPVLTPIPTILSPLIFLSPPLLITPLPPPLPPLPLTQPILNSLTLISLSSF
ncbi:tryptophan transporter, partial [Bacillus pumilus]|uniref:tryptophan transporter n=1 Tax=Bacillus pumilus TaxID=1408 RepID=UPI0034D95C5C